MGARPALTAPPAAISARRCMEHAVRVCAPPTSTRITVHAGRMAHAGHGSRAPIPDCTEACHSSHRQRIQPGPSRDRTSNPGARRAQGSQSSHLDHLWAQVVPLTITITITIKPPRPSLGPGGPTAVRVAAPPLAQYSLLGRAMGRPVGRSTPEPAAPAWVMEDDQQRAARASSGA